MYQIRIPKFLSPTSVKIYEKNVEEFATKYLLQNRPPREPQTEPMSVGSAFDAYVKSDLYYGVYGNYGSDNEYGKEAIFETQVSPHVRDFAKKAGQHCYDVYKRVGALAALKQELATAIAPPRFEFDLTDEIRGVPLLGKPDIYFLNEHGARCVYDWKVNGYCSWRNTSPMKGYVVCRDQDGNIKSHKDCIPTRHKGVLINAYFFLEDCNKEWADQLAIYSWLLGEEIGSEQVVFGIDQLTGPKDKLRVSTHRLRISPQWQFSLVERVQQVWDIIQSGHIFRELTREQSDTRLQLLEDMHKPSEFDDAFDY